MRILNLRLKNLNSLAGEWHIDFTDPSIASDGLLLISGPTGAGKSTILDALCLALYGRTPRLRNISRSENEIMSRRTGDCLAEVVFAVPEGIYACSWRQNRAYGRPDGTLQAPRQELIDVRAGKPLETRGRNVKDLVEQLTGMDFDQFTRSMLLAQGGFEAFLQASPDERAPLLEQITGTEIYSRISMQVHACWTAEKARRDSLREALGALHVLEEGEEQALRARQAVLKGEIRESMAAMDALRGALAWLEQMERLERDLAALEAERLEWEARRSAFAPEQSRLDMALRALELEGGFAALQGLREAQEQEKRALAEKQEVLPLWEERLRGAALSAEQAAQGVDALKKRQEELRPLFAGARQKDAGIAEQEKLLLGIGVETQNASGLLALLEQKQAGLVERLDAVQRSLAEHAAFQEAHAADAGLIERFSGIEQRAVELARLEAQAGDLAAALARAMERRSAAAYLSGAAEQELAAALAQRQKAGEALEALQQELCAALACRSLEGWQNVGGRLAEEKGLLLALEERALAMGEAQANLDAFRDRKQSLEGAYAEAAAHLEALNSQAEGLEREALLLEQEQVLQARIRSLEDARRSLKPGEPCPLCGALEHPFAQGPLPPSSDAERRLGDVRAKRAELQQAGTRLRVRQGEWGKELEQLAQGMEAEKRRYDEAFSRLLAYDAGIAKSPERCRLLAERRSAVEAEAARVQALILRIFELNAALRRQGEALRAAEQGAAAAQASRQESELAEKSALEALERLQKEISGLQERLAAARADFAGDVQPFGLEGGSPAEILDALARRLNAWKTVQQQRLELERMKQEMAEQQQANAVEAAALKAKHEALKQRYAEGQAILERLRQERLALLGTRDPDEEEARLAAALQAAEQALEARTQERIGAEKSVEALRSGIASLAASSAGRGETLRLKEAAFAGELDRAGFAGEAAFLAARLAEPERQSLARRSQSLANEGAERLARQRRLEEGLEAEKRRALSRESAEELERKLEEQNRLLAGLHQESGAIRERLEANEQVKGSRQEQQKELAAQEQKAARWGALHELIGSADGKKFRNFAQGLAFERVVVQANKALQRMSDRYLLKRSPAHPLELDVVDAYQGDEVRSTKNLSGGERFLVSLSLALGLSGMAGRSVRVDSLFLDEGFGTLDEEALETALDALMSLRRDGKQICVISHVQALKERIAAQIQVEPLQDGRSRLSGPGCTCAAESAR